MVYNVTGAGKKAPGGSYNHATGRVQLRGCQCPPSLGLQSILLHINSNSNSNTPFVLDCGEPINNSSTPVDGGGPDTTTFIGRLDGGVI